MRREKIAETANRVLISAGFEFAQGIFVFLGNACPIIGFTRRDFMQLNRLGDVDNSHFAESTTAKFIANLNSRDACDQQACLQMARRAANPASQIHGIAKWAVLELLP